MRRIHRQVWSILAVLAWVSPAAAQEVVPAKDRAISIERQIEQQIEKQIKITAKHVEALIKAHAKSVVLSGDILTVVAQAGRQAGEAARQGAQAAREAERRRRMDARRGPEYTEQLSKTVRMNRNGTLDLQNIAGNIQIAGDGGSDVRIEATKRVRNPRESDARAMLQAIDVRISERNGDVEVRTGYPRRAVTGGVDYTVSVPRDANVILRSVSGDIRVTKLNGELRAETVSGKVIATSARRIRQAKSMSGDIEITDSDADEVTGGTVSGHVIARGLKARAVDLRSVTGDLRLADVESDRAYGQTVSGNVEFTGRVSRNGRYELQSHSGNIRVAPLADQGFTLEASLFSGDLRSDYALTLQSTTNNFTPRRTDRRVRGSFGDGGALLTLQSFSGNITISKP